MSFVFSVGLFFALPERLYIDKLSQLSYLDPRSYETEISSLAGTLKDELLVGNAETLRFSVFKTNLIPKPEEKRSLSQIELELMEKLRREKCSPAVKLEISYKILESTLGAVYAFYPKQILDLAIEDFSNVKICDLPHYYNYVISTGDRSLSEGDKEKLKNLKSYLRNVMDELAASGHVFSSCGDAEAGGHRGESYGYSQSSSSYPHETVDGVYGEDGGEGYGEDGGEGYGEDEYYHEGEGDSGESSATNSDSAVGFSYAPTGIALPIGAALPISPALPMGCAPGISSMPTVLSGPSSSHCVSYAPLHSAGLPAEAPQVHYLPPAVAGQPLPVPASRFLPVYSGQLPFFSPYQLLPVIVNGTTPPVHGQHPQFAQAGGVYPSHGQQNFLSQRPNTPPPPNFSPGESVQRFSFPANPPTIVGQPPINSPPTIVGHCRGYTSGTPLTLNLYGATREDGDASPSPFSRTPDSVGNRPTVFRSVQATVDPVAPVDPVETEEYTPVETLDKSVETDDCCGDSGIAAAHEAFQTGTVHTQEPSQTNYEAVEHEDPLPHAHSERIHHSENPVWVVKNSFLEPYEGPRGLKRQNSF